MKVNVEIDDDEFDEIIRENLIDMRALVIACDETPELVEAFRLVANFYGAKL